MQTNLQSTTFNKHNYVKNDRVNQRRNPYINNISSDLSYKSHSITDASRNPLHINAGDDYLYYKRIEQLKRKLNQRQITLNEYTQAVRKIELSMNMTPSSTTKPSTPPMHNLKQPVIEHPRPSEQDIANMSDKDVIKMISSPDEQPPLTKPETQTETNA